MIRGKRWLRASALCLTMGVLVAACGGDDGDSGSAASSGGSGSSTSSSSTSTASSGPTPAETAEPFVVDASKCPAEATTALAAGAPVKLGFSVPQTGPLAGFGIIAEGMKVAFAKANEAGGIDGHPIELIAKDDAYQPDRTKTNAQEFLGSDKVFASVFQVGTPNVAAVRQLYEDSCTPQLWVGTGFPAWGDPKHFQFTTGGLLAYNTEAQLWVEWIKQDFPDGAKVAQLVFNNDFGKAYASAVEKAVQGTNIEIVETKLHEPTSTLNNEITALLAAAPDVILGETTVTFCTELLKQARQGGFDGPIMQSSTCASIDQFWVPAGEAAENGFILGAQKDPADPQYENDDAMKTYFADVAKYGPSLNAKIGSVLTGYNIASLVIDNLKAAAALNGGLSRVNLMNAAWNTDTTLPLALDAGRALVNGNVDAYISETTEVLKWDPDRKALVPTGQVFNREGETGLFAP